MKLKGDLEPLKSLVTDINTEITERTKNDKIIYENSYYEKRFEELIIEAIHAEQFYNLSCDIDNMLAKFFNKRSINESNSYAKHFFRQAYDYGRIPDSLKQALTGSREMFSGIHRSKYIALIKILETRIDCQHYTVEQPFYTLVGAISATIRDLKIQQGKTTCCQFRAKDDDLVSLLENILRKHLLNKHEECRNSYDAFVTKFSQEDIYNGNDAVNAAVLNQ
ncbi:MAG: hypothetical protein HWD59_11235 [Coxiellaceae bacterium]|nr:MAG: hypothetical protein HWD59_11235 [Coxiellaceae bacterium]